MSNGDERPNKFAAHLAASPPSDLSSPPIIEPRCVSAKTAATLGSSLTIINERTGKKYQVPVSAEGIIKAVDLKKITTGKDDKGLKMYDPGYLHTAPVRSSISYIDGDQEILRYRGYPIEGLAESSTFLEVAYLLKFYDLLNIFELNGLPSEGNPDPFNGDFVDRGSFSLEVILTFAFKCMSASAIYLARGNHESKSMNKIYGLEGEVRSKLSKSVGMKLSDIRATDRFCETPEEGLMCELLWSDPQPSLVRGPSKLGVSLSFGADVTKRFLQNNLELVVRSHEVKDEGYEIEHDGKLITVFSAPNYCDQMGNEGAFIRFEAKHCYILSGASS